jgi:hypothetical protein
LFFINGSEWNQFHSNHLFSLGLNPPGAGNGFGQYRVNLVHYFTIMHAFGQGFAMDAFFARTFDQVSDFEIIFKFEWLLCHYSFSRAI